MKIIYRGVVALEGLKRLIIFTKFIPLSYKSNAAHLPTVAENNVLHLPPFPDYHLFLVKTLVELLTREEKR